MNSLERLSGAQGSFYIGDAIVHNDLGYSVISITAPTTVISVLSGKDPKGNSVDLKAQLGLQAGPSLGLGILLAVKADYIITQIQLASGSVVLS